MNSPVLAFQDVSFHFSRGRNAAPPVLQHVTFSVESRERVALVGRSGSGKSTLLHLASGRLTPTGGTVAVAGVDLGPLTEDDRARHRMANIAQVYQDFRLLPRYTAVENVELPLLLRGEARDVARERALMALARVDLAPRATHRPGQLSGGEQQRVAIARAVVAAPALLLADEPTGALDAELRDEILALLFDVCRDSAIVLVTHDPVVAEAADRIVEVGHLTQQGRASLPTPRD
ncbi:ABC transporter ATP-binding protein [Micrococcales bacterium 31B]|nr:ABC transporter ATP-binding protein [Micrococcales bacterium 31B]